MESTDAPYGHLDASAIFAAWDGLRALFVRVEELDTSGAGAPVLTARKLDEAQPAGHRGYINAYSQLSSGIEHIDALQDLLTARATPRAPWTILRSIYEAGFWSCWLLEPADGLERRRRGLRAEILSYKQRAAYYDAFYRYAPDERARLAEAERKHRATYGAEAAGLNVTWSEISQRPRVDQALAALDIVKGMDNDERAVTEATWRTLSGMQHGLAYALMVNSDLHPGGRRIVGGRQQVVTINDDMFLGAAAAANILLIEGMTLYIRRSTTV